MRKRWKPNSNYYFIDATGVVSSQTWNDDCIDEAYYEFGNCFETKEQAEAASAKVKELLLGMSGEVGVSNSRLPKLTEEVFNRPDCPKWSKFAAVDGCGRGFYYEVFPRLYKHDRFFLLSTVYGRTQLIPGKFDSRNWINSIVIRQGRPSLPDWCRVDTLGWHKRCGYFKITYIDDVSKRVDIQQIDDGSRGYFSFHTICTETAQARPRPYNAKEMQTLVGKVLELDGNRDLVTSYDEDSESVYADAMWMNSDELLSNGYTIDGELCRVLEHLEGDTWVENSICKD